ncbi:hypothetical protein ACTHGP_04925 [[Pasteurella] aerogenes]
MSVFSGLSIIKQNTRFYISLLYIGVIAGLVGTTLTYCLHYIQLLLLVMSFMAKKCHPREGIVQSLLECRWFVLTLCSLLVGIGWYAIHYYGKKLRMTKQGLYDPQQGVPFFKTISYALLRIITVGLGSPLGRKVAPRKMPIAFGSVWIWIRCMGLSDLDATY